MCLYCRERVTERQALTEGSIIPRDGDAESVSSDDESEDAAPTRAAGSDGKGGHLALEDAGEARANRSRVAIAQRVFDGRARRLTKAAAEQRRRDARGSDRRGTGAPRSGASRPAARTSGSAAPAARSDEESSGYSYYTSSTPRSDHKANRGGGNSGGSRPHEPQRGGTPVPTRVASPRGPSTSASKEPAGPAAGHASVAPAAASPAGPDVTPKASSVPAASGGDVSSHPPKSAGPSPPEVPAAPASPAPSVAVGEGARNQEAPTGKDPPPQPPTNDQSRRPTRVDKAFLSVSGSVDSAPPVAKPKGPAPLGEKRPDPAPLTVQGQGGGAAPPEGDPSGSPQENKKGPETGGALPAAASVAAFGSSAVDQWSRPEKLPVAAKDALRAEVELQNAAAEERASAPKASAGAPTPVPATPGPVVAASAPADSPKSEAPRDGGVDGPTAVPAPDVQSPATAPKPAVMKAAHVDAPSATSGGKAASVSARGASPPASPGPGAPPAEGAGHEMAVPDIELEHPSQTPLPLESVLWLIPRFLYAAGKRGVWLKKMSKKFRLWWRAWGTFTSGHVGAAICTTFWDTRAGRFYRNPWSNDEEMKEYCLRCPEVEVVDMTPEKGGPMKPVVRLKDGDVTYPSELGDCPGAPESPPPERRPDRGGEDPADGQKRRKRDSPSGSGGSRGQGSGGATADGGTPGPFQSLSVGPVARLAEEAIAGTSSGEDSKPRSPREPEAGVLGRVSPSPLAAAPVGLEPAEGLERAISVQELEARLWSTRGVLSGSGQPVGHVLADEGATRSVAGSGLVTELFRRAGKAAGREPVRSLSAGRRRLLCPLCPHAKGSPTQCGFLHVNTEHLRRVMSEYRSDMRNRPAPIAKGREGYPPRSLQPAGSPAVVVTQASNPISLDLGSFSRLAPSEPCPAVPGGPHAWLEAVGRHGVHPVAPSVVEALAQIGISPSAQRSGPTAPGPSANTGMPSGSGQRSKNLVSALGLETSVPRTDDPHRGVMLRGLQDKPQPLAGPSVPVGGSPESPAARPKGSAVPFVMGVAAAAACVPKARAHEAAFGGPPHFMASFSEESMPRALLLEADPGSRLLEMPEPLTWVSSPSSQNFPGLTLAVLAGCPDPCMSVTHWSKEEVPAEHRSVAQAAYGTVLALAHWGTKALRAVELATERVFTAVGVAASGLRATIQSMLGQAAMELALALEQASAFTRVLLALALVVAAWALAHSVWNHFMHALHGNGSLEAEEGAPEDRHPPAVPADDVPLVEVQPLQAVAADLETAPTGSLGIGPGAYPRSPYVPPPPGFPPPDSAEPKVKEGEAAKNSVEVPPEEREAEEDPWILHMRRPQRELTPPPVRGRALSVQPRPSRPPRRPLASQDWGTPNSTLMPGLSPWMILSRAGNWEKSLELYNRTLIELRAPPRLGQWPRIRSRPWPDSLFAGGDWGAEWDVSTGDGRELCDPHVTVRMASRPERLDGHTQFVAFCLGLSCTCDAGGYGHMCIHIAGVLLTMVNPRDLADMVESLAFARTPRVVAGGQADGPRAHAARSVSWLDLAAPASVERVPMSPPTADPVSDAARPAEASNALGFSDPPGSVEAFEESLRQAIVHDWPWADSARETAGDPALAVAPPAPAPAPTSAPIAKVAVAPKVPPAGPPPAHVGVTDAPQTRLVSLAPHPHSGYKAPPATDTIKGCSPVAPQSKSALVWTGSSALGTSARVAGGQRAGHRPAPAAAVLPQAAAVPAGGGLPPMPSRPPPDPSAAAPALGASRAPERRALEAPDPAEAAQEYPRWAYHIRDLRREVGRLNLVVEAKEAMIRELGGAVERERSRKEENEDVLRRTIAELSVWQNRVQALEAGTARELGEGFRRDVVDQGLGICEQFLGSPATLLDIGHALAVEAEFVGVHCYTFDLEGLMTSLIAVCARGVRVCVLADERKTYESWATCHAYTRGQNAGVQIRLGRGKPLSNAYHRARPGSLDGRFGGSHAKVVFAKQARKAFVGSVNFTTSSMANAELAAEIALSPSGLRALSDWFTERWEQGVDYDPANTPARPRAYSRARSLGAARSSWQSQSPSPVWGRYAPTAGPVPPWPTSRPTDLPQGPDGPGQ